MVRDTAVREAPHTANRREREKERESLLNPVGAELAPFDETCPDFLVVRSKSSRRLSKK